MSKPIGYLLVSAVRRQQPLAKGGVLVGEEVKILIDVSAVRAS